MLIVAMICSLIPIVCITAALIGLQLAKSRRRKVELYRASPESHILNLRD